MPQAQNSSPAPMQTDRIAAASSERPLPPAPQIGGDIVSTSYACEGNRVDIVREGKVARIAMSDGRVVRLGAMTGSDPPTWRDVGLSFIKHDERILLEQDDGPVLTCEALER